MRRWAGASATVVQTLLKLWLALGGRAFRRAFVEVLTDCNRMGEWG